MSKQFPSLTFTKAYTMPELETMILDHWDDIDAFNESVKRRPASKPYVFYDGPPFVTGSPHYGSLLGSIAKDVIPRYWTMRGYRVERQWGWDCHGLPMENMIEKELGLKNGKRGIEAYGIANFNQACRDAITKLDATWEIIIRRIGRWVDFKHSYKTMDKTYMESVWWAFSELHKKDLIYQGKKVILFCPHCSTPLSNFEIAMDNSYVDVTEPGTTYKFPVAENTYILAWSTTPWTKIGTMALAVHPSLTYVEVKQGKEHYILAESRLSELGETPYAVVSRLSGTELVAKYPHYTPHYDWAPLTTDQKKTAYILVADEFVTADTGTGVVTLAVYGEDDYRVMQQHQIPTYEYVDNEGKLDTSIQKPEWVGQSILKVNPVIDADLQSRGLIYKEAPVTHSVATCYRCGTRLFYAPLPAWFVNVQKLKPQLIAQNEKINWYPDYLKHGRFLKGIETAPDWNISRSRYWGTPMPVWTDPTGKHQRIIGSLAELRQWAVDPAQVDALTDIHREFLDDLAVWVDDERTIQGKRIPDVFDVWMDSASMPFASRHYPFENKEQFEAAYPAQFISEYINQTRAWFYTMHVLSVGIFGQPSFLNAHTTGIILAADGTKMSKSKKNYTDPTLLIDQQGADALRLYLMSSPVAKAENLAFVDNDVANLRKRVLMIWWNTFVFAKMYKPANFQPVAPQPTHVMDKWILAKLADLREQITVAFDHYDITSVARLLIDLVGELSQWYLRQSRDRLRGGQDLAAWHTFWFVLQQLAVLAAPILPMLSDVMYLHLQPSLPSVHWLDWPTAYPYANNNIVDAMASIRPVVEQAHAQRKALNLPVRQPLASITVTTTAPTPPPEVLAILAQEINVKQVLWSTNPTTSTMAIALDTTLTPALQAEGTARSLMRTIQEKRKELQIPLQTIAYGTAPFPDGWQEAIEEKTHTKLTYAATVTVRQTA